jgi:hypothetical protein
VSPGLCARPPRFPQSAPRMRLTIVKQFYRPDISPTAHLSASLAEHRALAGYPVAGLRYRDAASIL